MSSSDQNQAKQLRKYLRRPDFKPGVFYVFPHNYTCSQLRRYSPGGFYINKANVTIMLRMLKLKRIDSLEIASWWVGDSIDDAIPYGEPNLEFFFGHRQVSLDGVKTHIVDEYIVGKITIELCYARLSR